MTSPPTPPVSDAAPVAGARRRARDRIFETARELFYRQGIRAVGVEAIAEQAGTTKMSLYRAFPGKDELVAECLRHGAQDFWAWWDSVAAAHDGNARAILLALFDELAERQKTQDHRGCPIANAAVELTAEDHPARAVVLAYGEEKRRRLRALCAGLAVPDPELLADSLQLLMDGACLSRAVLGAHGPGSSLPRAAMLLIDAAQAQSQNRSGTSLRR